MLDTNFTSFDLKHIKREVDLIRELRPNLGRYVYHTSLNFSGEERELGNEELKAIAQDYLTASGFVTNQFLVFRHHDAEHPHLHLLVNRISFDGSVVSDSNNYKKSEAIIRALEKKYGLLNVAPSRKSRQKAPTKDELEMVERTGEPSAKMALQEKLKHLLSQKGMTLPELIRQGERQGINFLFNQASTGRVSGITYFYDSLTIKGQALGNSFKWAEIITKISYEQIRDGQAISQANDRTKEIYGTSTAGKQQSAESKQRQQPGGDGLYTGDTGNPETERRNATPGEESGKGVGSDRAGSFGTGSDADLVDYPAAGYEHSSVDPINIPQISEDVDDEAVYGRGRRKYKGNEGMSR